MLPSMVSEVMSRVSLYSCFLLLLGHVAAQNREYDDTDLDEGKPFNPTMVIVAVIIILVSLFLVFLFVSVCMQRCLELVIGIDGGPSVDPGNSLNMRRQSARGLDASVIETFPTFLYSTLKTLRIGKEALECPVCLSEFEDDETLRLIPQCYHVFHLGCIDAWLPSHATCPLCRANLVPVPVDLAGETSKNSGETPMDDIRCECNIRLRVSD